MTAMDTTNPLDQFTAEDKALAKEVYSAWKSGGDLSRYSPEQKTTAKRVYAAWKGLRGPGTGAARPDSGLTGGSRQREAQRRASRSLPPSGMFLNIVTSTCHLRLPLHHLRSLSTSLRLS